MSHNKVGIIVTRLVSTAMLFLIVFGGPRQSGAAQTQTAPPPFSIDLVPVTGASLPELHSFSIAQANGKWLIFGGRTNGIHLFVKSGDSGRTAPPNAFPTTTANRNAWVIDPLVKRAWSAPLTNLPTSVAEQLSANNAQCYQDGNVLYIVGGYGATSTNAQMATYGSLIAVKVNETINAVIAGQSIAPYIQQTSVYTDCPKYGSNSYNTCYGAASSQCQQGPGWSDCMKAAQATCLAQQRTAIQSCINQVQSGNTQGLPTNSGYYATVTGGGLEKEGNVFYLVFGQQFQGLYSVSEGDYGKWPITQVYNERIVAFQFKPEPLSAAVLNVIQQDPNDLSAPYHRRDLNVAAALSPTTGAPRIAAYGGVFVPGQDTAYRAPIFIDNGADPMNASVTVTTGYQQMMSQYECANLKMFRRTGGNSGNMITVFFGGISLYYLDSKTTRLRMDEGLPFVESLTAMTQYSDNSWAEHVRALPLNGYMGADAAFVADPAVPRASNGVIYLDQITQRTKVGYVFGGILASQPQAGNDTGNLSRASNALYEVWINPTPPASSYWIHAVPGSQQPVKKPSGTGNK